jgi:hypothetical protein
LESKLIKELFFRMRCAALIIMSSLIIQQIEEFTHIRLTLTFEARTSEDLLNVDSLESLTSSLSFLRDDAGES